MRIVKTHQRAQQTQTYDERIRAMEALLDELAQENATLRFYGALRDAALTNALTGAFQMSEQLRQAIHHQAATREAEAKGDAARKERIWERWRAQGLGGCVLSTLTELLNNYGEQVAALADTLVSELLVSKPLDPEQETRPMIVCLCGSTRFMAAFQRANLDETLAGRIVLTVGCDSKDDAMLGLAPEVKAQLDQLHKDKIALADEVLVLNVDGYVGDSTRSEIAHAAALGKHIRWLEPPSDELLALANQQTVRQQGTVTVGQTVTIAENAILPPDYEPYQSQQAKVVRILGEGTTLETMLEVEVGDGTHVFLYPSEVRALAGILDGPVALLDQRPHLEEGERS